MPEARRFLRYVLPGLTCALEALVLLALWDPGVAKGIAKVLVTSNGALAAALGVVAASGVLGSWLARIHHLLVWWLPGYGRDYTRLSEQIEGSPETAYQAIHPSEWWERCYKSLGKGERHRRRRAWRSVHAAWYQRLRISKAATADAEDLTDVMQSEGAAYVGAYVMGLGFLVAAGVGVRPGSIPGFAAWVLAWLVIVLLHGTSYRETRGHSQGFDERVVMDRLSAIRSRESPQPKNARQTKT
jgi:hypothetical protein